MTLKGRHLSSSSEVIENATVELKKLRKFDFELSFQQLFTLLSHPRDFAHLTGATGVSGPSSSKPSVSSGDPLTCGPGSSGLASKMTTWPSWRRPNPSSTFVQVGLTGGPAHRLGKKAHPPGHIPRMIIYILTVVNSKSLNFIRELNQENKLREDRNTANQ
ncbi:hypothetical protein LAZ67_11000961 [Cordylochernes scorpioides]|uniref:Uncharacterized protein n=1 Tax=Cordylochernes scorpioides TaxID=51811 RepID=A0ABY6KY51_9ARAC|nr:hypothetical protein LAZ67_11000961 [Cordylochernes scorpioides]